MAKALDEIKEAEKSKEGSEESLALRGSGENLALKADDESPSQRGIPEVDEKQNTGSASIASEGSTSMLRGAFAENYNNLFLIFICFR